MQEVEYRHWVPHTPQTIYEFLTDPDALASVVGRIASARIMERDENTDSGKLAVVLDLPARKSVETVGEAKGDRYTYISFTTSEPFPLGFRWHFESETQDGVDGTNILSRLKFDLTAFGIPAAGMIVKGIIANELKDDMKRLEAALASS